MQPQAAAGKFILGTVVDSLVWGLTAMLTLSLTFMTLKGLGVPSLLIRTLVWKPTC